MKYIFPLFVFLFLSANTIAQKNTKPNIILILADDLGYGDIGCYGQQKIKTPNIDKLAKMGMKFTQFYAGAATGIPSRSCLMTGLHTGHTAVRGDQSALPGKQATLPDSLLTFPLLLQRAGYTTAAFGIWSLGLIASSGDPQKKGFDEFYGYNSQTFAYNYYPDHLWHNHDSISLHGNLKYDSVYSADLIHRQAINFLKAEQGKPFFLYLPYTLPHADVIVPHDSIYNYYVRKFNEQPVTISKNKNTDGERHHYDPYPHAAFAAMVTKLDKYVGDILKTIKEKGLEENTLIIFTSDNGPYKENGGDPAFFNSNGGLAGIKHDLYEGGIRVPFIAYRKGRINPGAVITMPCALWDLYPTFLQMADMPVTKGIDGVSLLPTFDGEEQNRLQYLYFELHEAGGKQAVQMGEWKAVRLNVSVDPDSPMELYNLVRDPQEKNNVASSYPAIIKQMQMLMKQAHVANKDWPLFPNESY